jgi:NAD(P)H dehydrogenase (quinone)
MNNKPRVLVMGATGQVGGSVASLLGKEPQLEVVAAARNPAKASHLGVAVVLLDLDRIETFPPALEGIDRLFMATGYTVDARHERAGSRPPVCGFRTRRA